MCQRRWAHAAAGKERERFARLRQHLAWQCEIDRTARFRHRHRERAVDHRFELVEVAKFVVPLGPLARDASLVEGFLRPVDVDIARAAQSLFGKRRTPRSEDDWYFGARRIHHRSEQVGGSDRDVNHHDLRPAGHQVISVGHAGSDHFMRNGDRLRHLPALSREPRESLDDRREVRAPVGEEIFDAASTEHAQIGLSSVADVDIISAGESDGIFLRRLSALAYCHDVSLPSDSALAAQRVDTLMESFCPHSPALSRISRRFIYFPFNPISAPAPPAQAWQWRPSAPARFCTEDKRATLPSRRY